MRIEGWVLALLALLLIGTCSHQRAQAHDEMTAESPTQKKVFQFYSQWNRPKGPFNIEHRKPSCCNRADCFPVGETKISQGRYSVRPEIKPGVLGDWFEVDPGIIESQQEDPRESPDGRSHVCIIGRVAACFVEGGGI